MPTPEVTGVGFNSIDHVFVVDQAAASGGKARVREYFQQAGGQVPTAMAALQKWGMKTSYAGPIAGDAGGEEQRRSLRSFGVDVSDCWPVADARTQTAFIGIDAASGERTILWHRDDSLRMGVGDVAHLRFDGVRAVLLDGDGIEAALDVAQRARAAGTLVVIDVDEPAKGMDTLLGLTDIAIVSGDLPMQMTGAGDVRTGLLRMRELGPSVAIATAGAGGAVAACDEGALHAEAFAVDAVDTTSAGDLYHAGFIFAVLDGEPTDRAMRFASAAAALVCTRLGGRAAIPELSAIRELLSSAAAGG